ncbi:hypothetical protein T4B_7351 [Trichinella pseudospiralis]|uniref:Integrase p58-like C-terminal domain-containing protein n=1 Tax=Trichinella pseudospiralis TaxID=6337 RepID=A0A0V1IA90_TRIPS|nr:hypothetical protein T4B_7351 [Trichinella pseudospiralis]KRZ39254.1 hypothetical protein T4C_6104 [Trichinella pseudospiralis]
MAESTSGDGVRQPLNLPGQTGVLRDAKGDVSTSLGYPALPTVSVRQEVHRPHRPQLSEMAAELCDPEGQVARWLERLAVFDFEGSPVEVPVGALQLDAANPIKQWQESDKELQQIREWSTQRTWPLVAPEGSRLTRSFWSQRDRIVVPKGTICRKWETPDTGETRLLQVILRQRIPKILAAVTNRQSGAHWVKRRCQSYASNTTGPSNGKTSRTGAGHARRVSTSGPDKEAPGTHANPAGRIPFPTGGLGHSGASRRNTERKSWLEAFALPNAKARTVAAALVNGLFCRYGAPETLHSDHDRNFESKLVKEVKCASCSGWPKPRPQPTTRTKAFIDHPDDWDAHLDRVLLAYQSSAHHTTGATRSRVIFRREMRLPVDLVYSLPRGAPEESVGEHTRRMRQDLKQLYKAVRGRAGREQRRQKFWKDRKAHRPVPYEVQKKQVWNTYWVKEMKGRRWRLVVHFDRLKPYQGSRQHGVGQQKPRGKRKTQIPTWVRDFMHDPGDEHGTCS